MITEVFSNLISNGIKYNDSPKKIIKIGMTESNEKAPKSFILKTMVLELIRNIYLRYSQFSADFTRKTSMEAVWGPDLPL